MNKKQIWELVAGLIFLMAGIWFLNQNIPDNTEKREATVTAVMEDTKIEETAPKKNIRELPIKNATTVVIAPTLPFFAKRAKFGVAVPPDTKEPTTSPAPPTMVRLPLDLANWSMMVPSPCCTAITIATVPRTATSGTAI